MLDRVTSSCLQFGVMMVNKCAKFQGNMSMDFEIMRGITTRAISNHMCRLMMANFMLGQIFVTDGQTVHN
jgi:hypothetical protein